jgi:hypothetical protein
MAAALPESRSTTQNPWASRARSAPKGSDVPERPAIVGGWFERRINGPYVDAAEAVGSTPAAS